jgi:hypothetical protein
VNPIESSWIYIYIYIVKDLLKKQEYKVDNYGLDISQKVYDLTLKTYGSSVNLGS